MRMPIAFVVLIVLLTPSLYAQARLSDEELIQAFLNCPEIINAKKELSEVAQPGTPLVILFNTSCGAVGCQYAALVAQPFERRKVNPFVRHLLGYVHVGPKGNITLVERLELVPINTIEGTEIIDE